MYFELLGYPCICVLSHDWLFATSWTEGFSVHGIFQTRVLESVAIFFPRGSSQPRCQTCISCIGRWILYHWATREALLLSKMGQSLEFSLISYFLCTSLHFLFQKYTFYRAFCLLHFIGGGRNKILFLTFIISLLTVVCLFVFSYRICW